MGKLGIRLLNHKILKQNHLNGFGLALYSSKSGYVVHHWSLSLLHIRNLLADRLGKRYVIVYKGLGYGGLRKADLSLAKVLTESKVPHKRLRNDCVSIQGQRFVVAAKRLGQVFGSGDFDFIDSLREPEHEIFKGFKRSEITFSYDRTNLPQQLMSSVNCHFHDDVMGGIAVKKRDAQAMTVGCLEEMFRREFRRLRISKSYDGTHFGMMPNRVWLKLRGILTRTGITVLRKDIRRNDSQLSAQCWLGFPERDRDFRNSFHLRYSLKTRSWSLGKVTTSEYPYHNFAISDGWKPKKWRRKR